MKEERGGEGGATEKGREGGRELNVQKKVLADRKEKNKGSDGEEEKKMREGAPRRKGVRQKRDRERRSNGILG